MGEDDKENVRLNPIFFLNSLQQDKPQFLLSSNLQHFSNFYFEANLKEQNYFQWLCVLQQNSRRKKWHKQNFLGQDF